MDFPYLYKINEKLTIDKLDNILKKFKISIETKKTLNLNKLMNFKLKKLNNDYCIIKLNYFLNKELNEIADYFTEPVRIKCITDKEKKISVYNYFNNYIKNNNLNSMNLLNPINLINLIKFRSFLYKQVKFCSNFNITMALNILILFKPKIYIDISSGWGDRLAAVICYNRIKKENKIKYIGSDPNKELKKYYNKMINTLTNDENLYKIYMKGFIETNHKTKCDFIFSSPPFFDIEIYSNNKEDSLYKNNTIDKWLNNFLYPVIKKSYNLLDENGHLILYIEDRDEFKFIENMINYAINIGFKNIGSIYYYYDDKNIKYKTVYRELFVFKK